MNTEYIQQALFWTFVPGMATNFLQGLFYRFIKNPPTAHQPRYRTHYNFIYACIVSIYLVFTIAQVHTDMPRNFYDILQVPIQFSSKELKMSYRALSLQYHPDKHQYLTEEAKEENHNMYIQIRQAYEILKNPETRSSYEKLRESILDCGTHCKTHRDYLEHGLIGYLGFYIGTAGIMMAMNAFGKAQVGTFWKFVLLVFQAGLEGWMLCSSHDPFHGWFFGWKTTGERIAILRHLTLAFYMAISQLGPLFFPANDGKSIRTLLTELDNVADMQAKEMHLAFKNAFDPFSSDKAASVLLQRKMEKLALDTKIDSDISKSSKKTQ